MEGAMIMKPIRRETALPTSGLDRWRISCLIHRNQGGE
jgi:hypothetical protein